MVCEARAASKLSESRKTPESTVLRFKAFFRDVIFIGVGFERRSELQITDKTRSHRVNILRRST